MHLNKLGIRVSKLTQHSLQQMCAYQKLCFFFLSNAFINPCVDELLVSIFHSFEAGIADAISSFK